MTSPSIRRGPSGAWFAAAAAAAVLTCAGSATAQTIETLVDFECSTMGCAPNGVLFQARDGNVYGTTSEGDFVPGEDGTVFRIDPGEPITITLLPSSAAFFFEADDGFLYGTTDDGGSFGAGSVFRMDGTGTILDEYSFDGTTASAPGWLVQAGDGLFYGTVWMPDAAAARLFRMDRDFNVTLLRQLRLAESDSNIRMLLAGSNGFLYGTTYSGLVFRMNRKGQTHALAALPSIYVDLMEASDGYFYGATLDGGPNGQGTIFRMTKTGKTTVLHSFASFEADGAGPFEAPIEGNDGYFYGTTYSGGTWDRGTIYRMTRSGVVSILHSFGELETDGRHPVGQLDLGIDGALYGTTVDGGLWGHGTAFRLPLAATP